MIGSSAFGTVFGAAPAGDAEAFSSIVKAAIRAGYSPVLLKPGGKETGCILAPRTAQTADKAEQDRLAAAGQQSITNVRHPCGFKHVLDDPAKISPIVTRFVTRFGGPPNLGLHLGRSRLIAVDVDTPDERAAFVNWWGAQHSPDSFEPSSFAPGITQESPGSRNPATGEWVHHGGGHWIFTVPDDWAMPAGKVVKGPGGFAVMYGESYILVPPSSRPEGPYRLVGGTSPAPRWLLDMITASAVNAERERTAFVLDQADPIEQWSAYWPWDALLEPDGWRDSGRRSDCGCREWTAPGDHASPKSATAHEPGCTLLDVSTGWGPLHIWTDHPPDQLVILGRTLTKLQYAAAMHYGGDVTAAMQDQRLLMEAVVPTLAAFADEVPPDPFSMPGGASTLATPAAGPLGPYSLPARRLLIQFASQMTPRATRWLWAEDGAQWLSLGGLSLLGGREGVGKSTWAYFIAAQVTRGCLSGAFYGSPRAVVVAATEDAWEQTIVPRLIAAGADLDRVIRIDVQTADRVTGLSLPTDVAALSAACKHYEVALILLDPLMGTVGTSLDSHKDADVRQALEPMSRMAHELQLTILGLIHQNKSTTGDLLTKLMGSRAFSAVARGVLIAARDTEAVDPDTGQPAADHYVFGQAKSNLGPAVPYSIRYRIESAHTGHDLELREDIWSSRIQPLGTTDERVGEIVERQDHPNRDAPALKDAEQWLRDALDLRGAVPSSLIEQEAKGSPHSWATVKRAAQRLGVSRPDPLDKRKTLWSITDPP